MTIFSLLLISTFLYSSSSQFISINVCSDLYCKNDCISWITSNGKCNSIDNSFNTITTLTSYAQYSDPSCNYLKLNTYITPIILDNTCQQLYIYGNQSPVGSYKGFNLSLFIGVIIGSIIFLIIAIICILYWCGVKFCCCKNKKIEYPQQSNAIIITNETQLPQSQFNSSHPHYDYTYGYQINQKLYNIYDPTPYNISLPQPLPSAPPAYVIPLPPPLPSAPPAYIIPLPSPLPSAPPAYNGNSKVI
jgi:hypothetical protein